MQTYWWPFWSDGPLFLNFVRAADDGCFIPCPRSSPTLLRLFTFWCAQGCDGREIQTDKQKSKPEIESLVANLHWSITIVLLLSGYALPTVPSLSEWEPLCGSKEAIRNLLMARLWLLGFLYLLNCKITTQVWVLVLVQSIKQLNHCQRENPFKSIDWWVI